MLYSDASAFASLRVSSSTSPMMRMRSRLSVAGLFTTIPVDTFLLGKKILFDSFYWFYLFNWFIQNPLLRSISAQSSVLSTHYLYFDPEPLNPEP
jgi:hypothetical protein